MLGFSTPHTKSSTIVLMRSKLCSLLCSPTLLHAGTPITPPAKETESWLKPTLEIRARYEFGDTDGLDPSHAFTTRERVGLKTIAWNGFSAFVEGEFSQAMVDDYNGSAAGADPFDPANTVIGDPETSELNQAYAQYGAYESQARLGRQRIIYDNAAFIGNVGWRQNEQTYDAISLNSKYFENLTLNYAYLNRVNRIFGSDAIGIAKDVTGDVHLFNVSYALRENFTLGGYTYLMDFDEPDGWDNQTFGLSAKATFFDVVFYGEAAWQNDAGVANDDEALYAHVNATKTFGDHSLTVGLEHLDAGFQTPLATVHAFNGFADVFIGQRIAGTLPGLTNAYVSHTVPIFHGIKWTNVLHAFGDNELSAHLGWEYDSVLTKKFDDHFTAIAKLAHFETESAYPTTTRFSVELNYTF